jgi:serine/threonine-protein kinase
VASPAEPPLARARGSDGGPVPIDEALKIAKQIAEALEHAHEKPIIHRDLKPANIKVTPEGTVKVLDFGLAKAYAAAGKPGDPPLDPMDIPTGSRHDTLKGTILGTPAYMSPEQASGRETDKRTDIWSFGCVLYEMLTGHWVFASQSPDPRQAGADRQGGGNREQGTEPRPTASRGRPPGRGQ